MEQEGADIIDIGGESTRPSATPISEEEELRRVLPVIKALRKIKIPISIDTTKAEVARRVIDLGVSIINDVSGFVRDPMMWTVAKQSGCGIVLMHSRGTPQTMQRQTRYKNIITEVGLFFKQQIARAIDLGIPKTRIAIDPGIGFAKTANQNLILLNRLYSFTGFGLPILIGPSRKSFIGKILRQEAIPVQRDRLEGTAAAVALAITHGAKIIRVHDVAVMSKVAQVAQAICKERT